MKKFKDTVNFTMLAIGKTQESKEPQSFTRYIGMASSYVLAVNPGKKKLDELLGFESQAEPEYIKEDEQGKYLNLTFIVRTDPESNNGIEITNRATITLRPKPAYNRDQTKVQVLDQYGNYAWVDTEIAKAGGKVENIQKLDNYHIACVGECALVEFLKMYLGVPEAYDYINGSWIKKENHKDGIFYLEHLKDYFNGNIQEIKDAINLQPNNKIKLLYGVRTTEEGKQYQTVCTREKLMAYNAAGSKTEAKIERELTRIKEAGGMPTTEYKVQPLQEYTVQPSNLSNAAPDSSSSTEDDELPW